MLRFFSRPRLRLLSIATGTLLWSALATAAPADPPPSDGPPPEQAQVDPPQSPTSLRVGDAEFKIGGFIDAVAVTRSRTVGSGLGTSFGAIPLPDSPAGNLSETRLTAQSSRLSLLATNPVRGALVKGYLEFDFLGMQPPNALVTTNANGPRMRHSWIQVRTGGFEFVGGQTWSLMTPNRQGVSPLPADVFFTQAIDPNFQVGLTWTRASQFRFVAHPSRTLAAAVALENPEQYVGTGVVLPASFPAGEVDNNGNTATPNPYPDIIGKVTWDPQTGSTRQHVEVATVVRGFRTFDPASSASYSKTGRGLSVNANVEPIHNLHLIATTFFSEGGGRYIFGLAPDFVINRDGSMTLVGSRSFVAGFEGIIKRATLFGYYGAAHIDQQVTVDSTGRAIGYGVPGNTVANRQVNEATAGVNYTFWREPRYGSLQWIGQYSYLGRTPWSVPSDAKSDARLHMVFISARYTLP